MGEDQRITFDQYVKMIEVGVFERDPRRIELIRGRQYEIGVPTPLHAETASRFIGFDYPSGFRDTFALWMRNPIAIPDLDSCPEPDVAWVKRASYRKRYPRADETSLIIEIADDSLPFDLGEKANLYAAAGIQDYGVVCLPERLVHVFRQPSGGAYLEHTTAGFGDELRPLAFPQFALSVSDLLGP
jgi:Uma2 family endonuclease